MLFHAKGNCFENNLHVVRDCACMFIINTHKTCFCWYWESVIFIPLFYSAVLQTCSSIHTAVQWLWFSALRSQMTSSLASTSFAPLLLSISAWGSCSCDVAGLAQKNFGPWTWSFRRLTIDCNSVQRTWWCIVLTPKTKQSSILWPDARMRCFISRWFWKAIRRLTRAVDMCLWVLGGSGRGGGSLCSPSPMHHMNQ